MKPVEQIETSLERMVPAALSRRATRDLEEMIDSLAIQDGVAPTRRHRWRNPAGWSAAAAALAIGAFSLWQWNPASSRPARNSKSAASASGIELLAQTDRVGEAREVGMLADDDGGMLRVLRYEVVEDELVRDKRSGITVRVTEPREETVLIPVSNF